MGNWSITFNSHAVGMYSWSSNKVQNVTNTRINSLNDNEIHNQNMNSIKFVKKHYMVFPSKNFMENRHTSQNILSMKKKIFFFRIELNFRKKILSVVVINFWANCFLSQNILLMKLMFFFSVFDSKCNFRFWISIFRLKIQFSIIKLIVLWAQKMTDSAQN